MATDSSTPGDMIVEAKQQLEEIIKTKDSKTPGVLHRDISNVISTIQASVNLSAEELKDLKAAVEDVKNLRGGPNTTDEARLGLYKRLVSELEKAEKKVSGGRRRRPSKKTRKSRKAKRSMRTRKMRRGGDLRGTFSAVASKVKEKGKAFGKKLTAPFQPETEEEAKKDYFTATGDYDTDMGVKQ